MTNVVPVVPGRSRLSWLDALRGLAALTVVYWHMRPLADFGVPSKVWQFFDLGKCGVVLFFLISGYIIPISLERTGDLRKFWISRIFRLYPAFLVATTLMLVLMTAGASSFPGQLVQHTTVGLVAHATMTQGLLGVSNLVAIYWTLSYEMVFYFVVAGLFAFGLHRHSAWYAAGLAAVALFLGPALPQTLLTSGGDRRTEAVIGVAIVFVTTIACFLIGSRRIVIVGAVLAVGMIGIVVANGGESSGRASWQSLVLLATMFTGTTIYRMQHGQIRILPGVGAIAAVLVAATTGAWWHLADGVARQLWVTAIVLPAVVFAAGFLLRGRQLPWVLRKLGELSYSMYLLHLILLSALKYAVPGILSHSRPVRLLAFACLLAVLFGLSELVVRFVEKPAQRLGRRVGERFASRFDRPVPVAPAPPAVPVEAALKG
jgi:peptidoglycan/LPS O-acetylase OafA/YrhL